MGAFSAHASDVQCMARQGGSWTAVDLPAAQISSSACSESFTVGTQLYKLSSGPSRTEIRVTCQWEWSSTGKLLPPNGTPESYACNLFL